MKSSIYLLLASFAIAQTPPNSSAPAVGGPGQLKPRGPESVSKQDPKRVVAIVNGQSVTAEDASRLISYVRSQYGNQMNSDLRTALQQAYVVRYFADEAAKQHIDQKPQVKEQLDFTRQSLLAQAYMQSAMSSATPSPDQKQKYYNDHKADFEQVQLSGIIIGFTSPMTPPGAPKTVKNRTQEEAKAKAVQVAAKLKGGADFAATAKAESDDPNAAQNGGALGSFRPTDQLPPNIKDVIFKITPGQVTEPIQEPNGYYILKVVQRQPLDFAKADPLITSDLQKQKNRELLQTATAQNAIQVQDQEFFSGGGSPGAAPATSSRTPSLANPQRQPGQAAPRSNGAANKPSN